MPNPAVAWIPLGIEPFGRVAHPAHGEGSHRHAAEAAINQKAGVFDGLDDSQFMEPHLDACKDHDKHVLYNGRAYATTPMGESHLDVAIRCKHVFGTIVDDYRTHDIRHVIVVSHGPDARRETHRPVRLAGLPFELDGLRDQPCLCRGCVECCLRSFVGSCDPGWMVG